MKICSGCNIKKALKEYYKRKKGKRSGQYYEKCKICMKQRGILYYHKNRKRQLELAIKRRHNYYKTKRDFIDSLKNISCKDCGKVYPAYVMDFDHKDGKIKVGNIASMITRNLSLKRIQKEIEKCDIVCANCHRIRTHNRSAVVAKVVTAGG